MKWGAALRTAGSQGERIQEGSALASGTPRQALTGRRQPAPETTSRREALRLRPTTVERSDAQKAHHPRSACGRAFSLERDRHHAHPAPIPTTEAMMLTPRPAS